MEKGDEHEREREREKHAADFAFYSRVPDSPESSALVTVVNCCLDRQRWPTIHSAHWVHQT